MMGSTLDQTQTNIEEEQCLFAMQLAGASVLPMALKTAIELEVLEIIAKAGPEAHLSPSQITVHLPTKNPDVPVMLDRILRLLASYSIFTLRHFTRQDGRVERSYGLAPMSKFLVRNEDGVSVAPLVIMNQDKVFMESWYHLKYAVVDGGVPFDIAHGINAFEYPGTDPRFNKVFNNGMTNHSTLTMKKILEVYKGFEQVKEVVDVGGGVGATLNMITSKYSHLKGINYDLPHVIADAPPYPGVKHVGGDMFVSVPKGEVIFMKWILHDWSDEHCLKLLKNCYSALPINGKVIVAEALLPIAPSSSPTDKCVLIQDMLMLAYNPGGKERTKEEYETLAKSAGFSGIQLQCCANNTWIMEFYKQM